MRRPHVFCGLLAAGLALASLPAAARGQAFLGKTVEGWEKDLDPGKTPEERRSAAFALGKLGAKAKDTVGRLLARLNDDDPRVREAAAFAIGEICIAAGQAYPDAVKALCERLANPKEEPLVRRSAAFALGAMRWSTPEALAALDAGLKAKGEKEPDAQATVRQSVAWALGRVGDAAIDKLREALKDPDVFVRRDAAKALNGLSIKAARQAVPELAQHCLVKDKGKDTVQLLEMRKAGSEAVVRILSEDKAAGPIDAKTREAVRGPLMQLLQDSDPDVRRNAALALGVMGGPEALAATGLLLEVLAQGDTALKDRAVAVLWNLSLKQQAAAALKSLGPAVEAAATGIKESLAKKDDAGARKQIDDVCALVEAAGPLAKAALPQLRPALEELVPQLRGALDSPAGTKEEKEAQKWKIQQATSALMKKVLPGPVAELGKSLKESVKSLTVIRDTLPTIAKPSDPRRESLLKQQQMYNSLQENLAICLIGTKRAGAPAFDGLLGVWADRRTEMKVRQQAAVAMSRVGDQEVVAKSLDVLLRVIGDATDAGLPRERGLWVLRPYLNYTKDEKGKEKVFAVLTTVLSEPLTKDNGNKMLRYDSAYLLGFFKGEHVPEKGLDVLGEYLKDTGTKIYLGVNITDVAVGGEGKAGGKTKSGEEGFGDGRQLAVESLQAIGVGRIARRMDLVAQLRALYADKKTAPNLREALQELMPDLEKELKSK
jgi:HEAT repeat protein